MQGHDEVAVHSRCELAGQSKDLQQYNWSCIKAFSVQHSTRSRTLKLTARSDSEPSQESDIAFT